MIDSSSPQSHGRDLSAMLRGESEICREFTRNGDMSKPILFWVVDGGPDENIRHAKVVNMLIKIFKEFNLDGIFSMMYAPGYSAYNRVERRMAPLSHDVSGIILPHEHHGTHLNDSGETIDEALEKRNFKKAGEVLAGIWRKTVINKNPVDAKWCEAVEQKEAIITEEERKENEKWTTKHCQFGQYSLNVVKCMDR